MLSEVNIVDTLGCLLSGPRSLNDALVQILLENNEPCITLGSLELKQVFRNLLLGLNRVVILLVSDQVSTCLLRVLQLLELDDEDVVEPFEVLGHVVDVATPLEIEGHLIQFTLYINFQGGELL